ncbi:MBL fold metallo-hydrolase [Paenibacillus oenotherae]|uniref:MBL fold metallo-hydrolase n=1 Tax=Paenibacillus oenotherae TaxID=1435645 RepID=A0ABS7DB41_9BACL|nr:MBL fold metallo-hydrolase [Paenibacillus oenotherae]MBW7476378.1 MBL fold metallo-hydrolase [Paenibacillus oenotherae]
MPKLRFLFLAVVVLAITAGCASKENKSETAPTANVQNETPAEPNNETAAEEPPVEDPIPPDTTTLANTSGKTLFRSITSNKNGDGHASIGIVSKGGTVIAADPNTMATDTTGLIKADIITVTHNHSDHTDEAYIEANKLAGEVKYSEYALETFTVKDVTVTGISSGHSAIFSPDAPSNVIYVYEVDGLRVAHMGDVAQNELTEEQIGQIGKLDIAFLPFSDVTENGFTPAKTVKILQQLQPKIASPLHYTPEAAEVILQELGITERSETDVLTVDKADLDKIKGTSYVFLK